MHFTQTLLLATTAGLVASLSVDMGVVGDTLSARSTDGYSNPEGYESLHARPNIQNPEPFKEEYAAAKEVHDEEALVKYSQGNNRDDLDTIYRRAPTANQNLKQCLKSLKDLKALQAQKQTLENKAQDLFNRAMDMQDNARRLLTPPKTVQKAFKDSEAAFTAVSTFVRNNDTKMRRLQGEVDKCRAQNFGGMSTETLIKG